MARNRVTLHGGAKSHRAHAVAETSEQVPATALIVDDEEGVRRMLTDLLEQAGYACVQARDGEEALQLLQEHQPRLGVFDINLPGISGAELAWRVKEREPTIALVALSGVLQEWDRDDLRDLGFDRVFKKPMDCDEFLSFCRSVGGLAADN
jgi:DNA-binding response OmpR family regulator